MIGRQEELDELIEFAYSRFESFLLVVGETQSGRTALLGEVRRRSTVRAVLVAAHPTESSHPLSGLSMVLNAVGNTRLAEFVGRFTLTDRTDAGLHDAARDVLLVLRGLQIPSTLVLIDNVDAMDVPSQTVLAFIATRLTGTGLQLIGTTGPCAAHERFVGVRSMRLNPLDSWSARLFARDIAGRRADGTTLDVVCAGSSGLPGVIATHVSRLTAHQLDGEAPLSLPLLPARQAPLDESLASDPILTRLAAAPLTSTAALDPITSDDRDLLERHIANGVIEMNDRCLSICDPDVRSQLYWNLSSSERRTIHQAGAAAEAEINPSLAAWHRSHTGAVATNEFIDLARSLVEGGHTTAGVELIERALLTTSDIRPHISSLLDVATVFLYNGDFGHAGRYTAFARRSAAEPTLILRAVTLDIVVKAVLTGRIGSDEADVYVGRYGSSFPDQCAELLSTVAALQAAQSNLRSAASRIERSRELSSDLALPSQSIRYWIHRLVDTVSGLPVAPRMPVDLDSLPVPLLLISGKTLSMEEQYEDARRAFAAIAVSGRRNGTESYWASRAQTAAAENEVRAGRIRDALTIIEDMLEASEPFNLRNVMLYAWRLVMTGEADEAISMLDEGDRIAREHHHPAATGLVSALQGNFALMRGDLDEAMYRLEHAEQALPGANPAILRVAADRVEALFQSGHKEEARLSVEEFQHLTNLQPSHWSRLALARARVVIADDDSIMNVVDTALTAAHRGGSPFEIARLSYSCAVSLGRAGRADQSNQQRRIAERLFEHNAAVGWVQATRAIEPAGMTTTLNPLLSTLTDNELAVLRLIQRGARNREIAAALFVSLRTVETRITQIYRKLDAHSRSHLLTLLPIEVPSRGGELVSNSVDSARR
jgi:DNA-binding NarL/FixJ family response regulator